MTLWKLDVLLIDVLIKMLMQKEEERSAGHIAPILLFPHRHQSESSCAESHKYNNGKKYLWIWSAPAKVALVPCNRMSGLLIVAGFPVVWD